jgi:leucyl-tRNA synthetase
MIKYNPQKIEKKWQKYWQDNNFYQAKDDSKKPKKYILVEFPYPSGTGLHIGHVRSYVAGDVTSRYFRSKGFEVMYPYGWDAFGLPAENYAIKMGIQPEVTTEKNIQNIIKQVRSWGLSFDWSREVNTTDPDYYKWTQWLFLQFFKAGLAYEATAPINWCPKDKTGLANEEVVNGLCDRCGTPVERRDMRQWYLKITAYAQKLIDGLEDLDWPEAVKLQQINWIGRSEGAEIQFALESGDLKEKVAVFTTRPDTLFGATYLVLAPEHSIVELFKNQISNWSEVQTYITEAKNKTDLQRSSLEKEKTGVELKGVFAINPANGEKISVWIADYVLNTYGTGAIMAVPGHDERDKQFADKFKLPIIEVVEKSDRLKNSGEFNGLEIKKAKLEITKKFGKSKVQYKLRDWLFSRQRYWGEPIPLIHCNECGIVPVPDKDLPVTLPKVKKYEPTGTGESPLAAIDEWVKVECPKCGGPGLRETNTMPQWAGSSWYYLRYTDPKNDKEFASIDKQKYWLPVDLYFGGMEHTTLHLLYSRFWNQFLYDQGLVPVSEPYKRRQPHGIVLGPDGEKMSKSKGNVINPDDVVKEFGADTLRMFELFMGPHEQVVSWNDKGTIGVYRFLQRVWTFVNLAVEKKISQSSDRAEAEINKLIRRIGDDIEGIKFNTAVSGFMEFVNAVSDEDVNVDLIKKFLIVLSPLAPHISEELWEVSGAKGSVNEQTWPEYDESKLQSETVQFVLQVNGKFRGNIDLPKDTSQDQVERLALEISTVQNALDGKKPKKVIFVANKIINFVI